MLWLAGNRPSVIGSPQSEIRNPQCHAMACGQSSLWYTGMAWASTGSGGYGLRAIVALVYLNVSSPIAFVSYGLRAIVALVYFLSEWTLKAGSYGLRAIVALVYFSALAWI